MLTQSLSLSNGIPSINQTTFYFAFKGITKQLVSDYCLFTNFCCAFGTVWGLKKKKKNSQEGACTHQPFEIDFVSGSVIVVLNKSRMFAKALFWWNTKDKSAFIKEYRYQWKKSC